MILSLVFTAMLILTAFIIYAYMWKRGAFRSYPVVFSYTLLVIFCSVNVVYELYMAFRCGKNDCFSHLLVSMMPEYRNYFFNEQHKSYLVEVSIIWKIKQ